MTLGEEKIHTGHRMRMREKLVLYGREIFHTYELLEMLLYYTTPYKDTNPIAKRLLSDFSSLDGVLTQDRESLMRVSGVGERSAAALTAIYDLTPDKIYSIAPERKPFSDKANLTEYYLPLFDGGEKSACYAAYLNNSRELAFSVKLSDSDFDTDSVKVSDIVGLAVEKRSASVILIHSHAFPDFAPTEEDLLKNRMVRDALARVGVTLLAHPIVSGRHLFDFMGGLEEGGDNEKTEKNKFLPQKSERGLLLRWLRPLKDKAENTADALLSSFNGILGIAEADIRALISALSGDAASAVYTRLIFDIASRRVTDKFKTGGRYSYRELSEYIKAKLFGLSAETAYVISFADDGSMLGTDRVAEGTVNQTEILPRRILEALRHRGADSFILAHNHPGGLPEPSDTDIRATRELSDYFSALGYKLISHAVTAKGECRDVLVRM